MKEIPRWQLCSGRRGGQSTLEQCYSSDTLRLKISLPICISLWPWQSLSEPESHLDTDAAFLTCIYEAPALSSKSCCPSHLRILTFPIKIFWVFFFFFFCHIPPNCLLTLNLEAEITTQPILPFGFSGLGHTWPSQLIALQIPRTPLPRKGI